LQSLNLFLVATIKRFEELAKWQDARRLSKEIILISKNTNLNKYFRCNAQIKGSSGSVMDNIAEGFERNGNAEFRQFLTVAKGSARESRSQLYRVFDNVYINEEQLKYLVAEYEKLSVKIHNFITYLNKKDYKGTKCIDSQTSNL